MQSHFTYLLSYPKPRDAIASKKSGGDFRPKNQQTFHFLILIAGLTRLYSSESALLYCRTTAKMTIGCGGKVKQDTYL